MSADKVNKAVLGLSIEADKVSRAAKELQLISETANLQRIYRQLNPLAEYQKSMAETMRHLNTPFEQIRHINNSFASIAFATSFTDEIRKSVLSFERLSTEIQRSLPLDSLKAWSTSFSNISGAFDTTSLQEQIRVIVSQMDVSAVTAFAKESERYKSILDNLKLDDFDLEYLSGDLQRDNIDESLEEDADTTSLINYIMTCAAWIAQQLEIPKNQRIFVIFGIISILLQVYYGEKQNDSSQQNISIEIHQHDNREAITPNDSHPKEKDVDDQLSGFDSTDT